MAVKRTEHSRPVPSDRNKEPEQRADSAERAILRTITSPTIDDEESQLSESDSEEEDGTMDADAPPRKRTYGPLPNGKELQNISRRELRNYIFLAACVKHARKQLKVDWSALSEELGIFPHAATQWGQTKLSRLRKRLVEEGAEFGHPW